MQYLKVVKMSRIKKSRKAQISTTAKILISILALIIILIIVARYANISYDTIFSNFMFFR